MSELVKPATNPLRRRASRLAGLVLTAAAVLTACDSSGPVDDVFLFEGELVADGSVTHSLVTSDEGIARFAVSGLRPRLVDITIPGSLLIGVGIGRPGDEACQTSFRTNARLGSVFSVGLEKETEYCVLVFDSGSLPDEAIIDYTITVSAG